jgi:hypothetical protein
MFASAIQPKSARTPRRLTTVSGRLRNSRPTQAARPLKISSASASYGKNNAPITA